MVAINSMRSKLVLGNSKICADIAAAFGIPNAREIDIYMSVDSVVSVNAVFFPSYDQMEKLESVIKFYNLKVADKEDAKDNAPNKPS
jgi:hypothetical protein